MNAIDEMHEINDWFGRSQNEIAESERKRDIRTMSVQENSGRACWKNSNHVSMDVINEW